MRLLRSLTVLLALASPMAFADDVYQVEMILVRQNAEPVITSRAAPEDWAGGAQRLSALRMSPPRLGNIVEKLSADSNYTVLLHRAWEQTLGETPSSIAMTDGQEQFGQYPIEGTLTLKLGRFTDVDASFWINKIDNNGLITSSERLLQNSHTKNGQLNYLDNGHLALLFKITSLTTAPMREAPPDVD